MNEWQPIETAPKDGKILLGGGTKPWVTCGWWDSEFRMEINEEKQCLDYTGAWTDGTVESWGMEENTELHPTHWQPLPEPPTT